MSEKCQCRCACPKKKQTTEVVGGVIYNLCKDCRDWHPFWWK